MSTGAVVLPSDVRDGDLLTGTLYGNPFTDWPVRKAGGTLYFGNERTQVIGGGDPDPHWSSCVTVTSRKPAPAPPLPWVEHADAWWQSTVDTVSPAMPVYPSSQMGTNPAVVPDWRRVAVIPWGLIENLRVEFSDDNGAVYAAAQAILDAADGGV